ncbi:DUF5667 domain-containing protein [Chloroflexota bacterium]
MKRFIMVPLISILALMLCFGGVAYAQEGEALPDPGITPDSPFYFADKWGKQISLMFTFKAENKVQKALQYADERLAEVDAMIAKNKVKEATEAAVAKIKEEAAKAVDTLGVKVSGLESELNDLKDKVGQEALAVDRAFVALKDKHIEDSPFLEK